MDDEHAEATVVRADADDADSANQFMIRIMHVG